MLPSGGENAKMTSTLRNPRVAFVCAVSAWRKKGQDKRIQYADRFSHACDGTMDLFPQGKGGPSVFERPRLGVYRPVGERHYPSSCARTHISRNTHCPCLPALPRLHLQGYLVLLFLSLYLFISHDSGERSPLSFFFFGKK